MKKEAQRIAIAEACGRDCDPEEAREWDSRGQWCCHPYDKHNNKLISQNMHLPDYLNDLNAMHKAEKVIRKSWDTYFEFLIKIRWRDAQPERHPADLSPAGATAAQRAEAFLKTLGLWEEETPDDDSPDCDFDPYGRDVMDRIDDIADKNDRI